MEALSDDRHGPYGAQNAVGLSIDAAILGMKHDKFGEDAICGGSPCACICLPIEPRGGHTALPTYLHPLECGLIVAGQGRCCTDRHCVDIEAVCSFQDVVNAAQVQR